MHYVYVIKSKKDKKWYTGLTDDLRERFREHSYNKVFSTKGRGPFEVIYYEAYINREDAREREIFEIRHGKTLSQESPEAFPFSNGV